MVKSKRPRCLEFHIGKLKITLGIRTLICFIIFLLVVAIDIGTKTIQETYDLRFDIIPDRIGVTRVIYNDGVSFGWLSGRIWLIEMLTTILVVALFVVFFIVPDRFVLLKLSVGFVMGGAIGNLADRYAFGYVRDFIYDDVITHTTLNMADLFITVGVILIVIDMLFLNEWSVFPVTKRARQVQREKKEEDAKKLMKLSEESDSETNSRTSEDVMNDFLAEGPSVTASGEQFVTGKDVEDAKNVEDAKDVGDAVDADNAAVPGDCFSTQISETVTRSETKETGSSDGRIVSSSCKCDAVVSDNADTSDNAEASIRENCDER